MTSVCGDRFRKILDCRKKDRRFDGELWTFMSKVSRNLQNLSDSELDARWVSIVKNILFVVGPSRDEQPIEAGAFSSWWWLRAFVQTECELGDRSRTVPAAPEVLDWPPLRPEFITTSSIAQRLWARVGRQDRLNETLEKGNIRFGSASSFDNPSLNAAQKDLELEKSSNRPGQSLRIERSDGRAVSPIGDVTFTTRSAREIGNQLVPVDYWLSSWSIEFDPRLCHEFGANAIIVVWDPDEFAERVERAVERKRPGWTFADIPIQYFDPYDLQPSPNRRLHPSATKDFAFGYQRELRLAMIQPDEPIPSGDAIVLEIGSLQDIAGLYDQVGTRIAGTGPESCLTS